MKTSQRGFTLLELLVASSIGLTVILVMMSLFKTGMDASMKVTQRAETQQNVRAAVELMTKDISLAGGGLPSGGLQLGTAGLSRFACNQAGKCYITGGTYPNSASGTANYMYAIEPGFAVGVENGAVITAAPGQTNSSITAAYCDYNFPLTNFNFTIASATQANVAVINGAVTPNNILAPGGLQVGDLLLFLVSVPGSGAAGNPNGNSLVQTAAVVGEITGIPSNTVVNFATGDALNFNFSNGSNNLASVAAAVAAAPVGTPAQTSVCRLEVVSYFLEVPVAGGTVQTPRLMRQVNGLNAVPVADGIINLQFTYDVINSVTGTVIANVQNPIGAGDSPSLIQKVNIWIMGSSLTTDGNRSQSMYLATSVSTRDMSFCNSYGSSTTVCQ
ncbi:MAG TPA: prepilin-type N-terminal cleavage/methylation domain-containing protein [Candidatus Sulfotelmatobacter sp.]|nr:prepilin-type N-terminal cleavage/methylation domain-containing protein [Candidatus Sulfotelmatobacter sp.]